MDIYGIEHRKKVAAKYNLAEQEIIDMPRDKFEIFVSGLEIGEKYGARKIINYLKEERDKEQNYIKNDEEALKEVINDEKQ